MKKENPFTQKPVKEMNKFVGRKDLIFEIRDMLLTQQNCHIIGERKTGKTSLLFRIAKEFEKEKEIRFIFLDMMQFSSSTPQQILAAMTNQIDETRKRKKITYREFEDFISDKKVILALDEIAAIVENEQVESGFFNFLRAISSNFEVAYLTTHTGGLYSITKEYSKVSSPFFNIFRGFHLGYLTEQESRALIQLGGEEFSSMYSQWILEKAYYHPFLLQMMCQTLFEHYKRDGKGVSAQLERKIYHNLEEHFRYWYDKSTKEEKDLLIKVGLKRKGISADEEGTADNLERRLLFYKKNVKYHLVSPFFEEVLQMKKKEARRGEESTPKKGLNSESGYQPYLIILMFLIFGLLLSMRMEGLVFPVFYVGGIIFVLGLLIHKIRKEGIPWRTAR